MHANDLYVVDMPRLAIDREAAMVLGAPCAAPTRRSSPRAVIRLFYKVQYVAEGDVLTTGQVRVLD